ncbi:hypothetical protein DRI50_08680 [candidate division KSB1 bacterium]|nr:MAG: hypothetical protein DRI50_08680 [candidate division KSB1 bacterium]
MAEHRASMKNNSTISSETHRLKYKLSCFKYFTMDLQNPFLWFGEINAPGVADNKRRVYGCNKESTGQEARAVPAAAGAARYFNSESLAQNQNR